MKKLLLIFLILSACVKVQTPPPNDIPTPVPTYKVEGTCKGEDFLALARMDLKVISKYLPDQVCIGVLQGTFGDVTPALKVLLSTGKVEGWRMHLGDATCIRNHTCSVGSVQYSDYSTLQKRAVQAEAVHTAFPSIPCYLSAFLEHDSKDVSQVNKWYQIIGKYAPSCTAVVSAFTGYKPPGILQEYHGQYAHGDLTSHDGFDGFQAVGEKWDAKRIAFFWTNRWNLRYNGDHAPTPPPPLKRTAFPTKDQIIHSTRLFNPIEPQPNAPTTCTKVLQITSPELSKVRSEDFGPTTTDVRSDKPMLIAKLKTSNFTILSPKGVKIGCAKLYPGIYNGMNRYYEGNCSGLTAVGLMDKGGSEWSFWQTGHTCYAYNNIRRLGAPQK